MTLWTTEGWLYAFALAFALLVAETGAWAIGEALVWWAR